MRKLLTRFIVRLFKPVIVRYTSKPTNYRYEGIDIIVFPGVFHPRFFFSTRLLLTYLKKIKLKDQSFLELGAGSGLISLFAEKGGAKVTASDISSIAIENINRNKALNKATLSVIHSDLFTEIPRTAFDIIVINPPYYKKNPSSEPDHAWYCGEDSQYFRRLFSELGNYINKSSTIIMVLADVCDIPLIISIAAQHQFRMDLQEEHEKWVEKNFIYKIELQQ